ncbi:glycosyltransferase family 39 protein [Mucilaginibacter sp. RS28]|uniref:Glycosyltransferase family 39 protein n=1 Tax=Mucilaginibacter straminoryzae TaxID=2932774 RepID=A0A9X2BC27_9SPHI|nr:glycosyltransferase family 39 protein [Mucilaginibacter straminoryzae]MCJ8210452.1 glycosyltransferase family 39 protein [Mucilaginibacter straminoryzae]
MTQNKISGTTYFWLFVSLLIAYILGLLVPLMDEDASHHANIALHMVQHHDYVNLVDDLGKDYLDKPHLHFWLAALSFNIFGVNDIAYKIPSFLMTLVAIYATYRLAKLLYNQQTGLLAALVVASAQAEFLANNDVRMDALLMSGIIIATWQLVEAAYFQKWYNYVFAALGLAIGFTTKGMIGFVMPCVSLFFLLLYQRNWKRMFDWRWIIVLILWAVFISPCVYCYYLQYDLHPEKVVRGMRNVSGVKFILWNQNFERLEGKHWGKGHKDYFFFFHTALWAFLPWCLLTYYAFFDRIAFLFRTRFAYVKKAEMLTVGTIIIIFAIISSSGYQLPHYLNVLFPIFAVLTAGHIINKAEEHDEKALKISLYIQYFVAGVILFLLVLLNLWCFPVKSVVMAILALVVLGVLIYAILTKNAVLQKIVVVSALTASLTNVLLNGNVYMQLLNNYQAGITMAKTVKDKHIPVDAIYNYGFHSSSFNFHARHLATEISADSIQSRIASKKTVWLFMSDDTKKVFDKGTIKADTAYSAINYGITRLTPKFLNPATREQTLEKQWLVKVSPEAATASAAK